MLQKKENALFGAWGEASMRKGVETKFKGGRTRTNVWISLGWGTSEDKSVAGGFQERGGRRS